jgi:hypothetical protein
LDSRAPTIGQVVSGNCDVRVARISGIGFALLFMLALTVLLGELFGAFADSASSFGGYFDGSAQRLRHALGAYLLAGSGLAFLAFVVKGTAGVIDNPELATDVRMAGLAAAVFASLVGLAAAALATVSLSIGFGQITGDPGIRDGQELLPQLGYVVIAVPAALSAALAIWFTASVKARSSALPGWIVAAGYVVAAAQLLSFYTLPLILLPLWVLAASFGLRKPR